MPPRRRTTDDKAVYVDLFAYTPVSDVVYCVCIGACIVVGFLIASVTLASEAADKVHAARAPLHNSPPEWDELEDALNSERGVVCAKLLLIPLGCMAFGWIALMFCQYRVLALHLLLTAVAMVVCAVCLQMLWGIPFYVMSRWFYFTRYVAQ